MVVLDVTSPFNVLVNIYFKAILKKQRFCGFFTYRGNRMAQFCVMVKGPCRGKKCDFWARVKIRKASIEELASRIKEYLLHNDENDSLSQDELLCNYWADLGVRDRELLCREEPDLCVKMVEVETLAKSRIDSSKS